MSQFYPLKFKPILKERVWGGRNLERLYQKPLPPDVPIGESWEISDRPDDESQVAEGPLAGRTLHDLMRGQPRELIGPGGEKLERFPLLIKILDAQDILSLQVHPPASVAAQLGGEPKTEMWYVAEASPEAVIYAGLKRGVTREAFERRLRNGTVAECVHRFSVQKGDALFIPSGRLHALGAGLVIFEIQQNSDTTYRVFDWNRVGLDGKPRQLHIEQSLASINFDDFEPSPIRSEFSRNPSLKIRFLVQDPLFRVDAWRIKRDHRFYLRFAEVQLLGVLEGRLCVRHDGQDYHYQAGEFALLPAALERVALQATSKVELLHVQLGEAYTGHASGGSPEESAKV